MKTPLGRNPDSEQESDTEPIPAVTGKRIAAIEARHATDPIWQWLSRSSNAYWGFAARVAAFFLEALHHVQSSNPFLGIAYCLFYFVGGFMVVTPLYMLIGPLVQVGLTIIAVVWVSLAAAFGWNRPSPAQIAQHIAQEQRASSKKEDGEQSFAV